MNTLRNIFNIRTFNLLRQNALINATQQQQQTTVDSNTASSSSTTTTTVVDTKGNITSAIEALNQTRHPTEPLFISKRIIDATGTRFKDNNLLNNTITTKNAGTATITNRKNGTSMSPTTLKLYRSIQRKMDIVYTCKLCNTRNSKQINEAAYTNGVVILQCDGCNVNHLIIDNLGWFTTTKIKEKSFNDILNENSKRIKVIKVNENDELI